MEILRIGDKLEVAGYVPVTLTADMNANIAAFAQANGISAFEASGILNNIPALKNFIQNLQSADTENYQVDNYDFSFLKSTDAKTSAAKSSRNKAEKAAISEQKDADSQQKVDFPKSAPAYPETQSAPAYRETQSAPAYRETQSAPAYRETQSAPAYVSDGLTSKISNGYFNIPNSQEYSFVLAELDELNQKKSDAIKNLDETLLYALEMEENGLQAYKKSLIIAQAMADYTERGEVISPDELKLLESYIDNEYVIKRNNDKIQYLQTTLDYSPVEFTDDWQQYEQETKNNNIVSLINTLTIENNKLSSSITETGESIALLNSSNFVALDANNPDKKRLVEILSRKEDMRQEYNTLASQKLEYMQMEDDYAQYTVEQQENALNQEARELAIEQAQLLAKIDGREISGTELNLIGAQHDIEFREQRLQEKMSYLLSKISSIQNQKYEAMQAEDDYAQYVLEQQENAINALHAIFAQELANIEQEKFDIGEEISLLQSEPLASMANNQSPKKDILEIVAKQQEISAQSINIATQKSEAMQAEDDYAQYQLEQQENELNRQFNELAINKEKLLAQARGQELSDIEIELLQTSLDLDFRTRRVNEKLSYLDYKSIGIAQSKSIAMQAEDEQAQYTLEQQENSINSLGHIFQNELSSLNTYQTQLQELLTQLRTEPFASMSATESPKKEMLALAQEKKEVLAGILEAANEKDVAMQTENDNDMYFAEQKGQKLQQDNIELAIRQAELVAQAENRTLSDTERNLLRKNLEASNTQNSLYGKMNYLSYQMSDVIRQQTEAYTFGDEQTQYILEQKESSLNAMSTIFGMEYDANETIRMLFDNSYYHLSQEPLKSMSNNSLIKKDFLSCVDEKMAVQDELMSLLSKRSEAMQMEDTATYTQLDTEIEKLFGEMVALELKQMELVAKAKQQNLTEAQKQEKKEALEKELADFKVRTKVSEIGYQINQVQSMISLAEQNNDTTALTTLRAQEAELFGLLSDYIS